MSTINEQIVARTKILVESQILYDCPSFPTGRDPYNNVAIDIGRDIAVETIGETGLLDIVRGAELLSDASLLQLAAEITLHKLFSFNSWIEEVRDYMIKHQDQCVPLWNYMESLGLPAVVEKSR